MRNHTKTLIRLIETELDQVSLGCEVGVWKGGNSRSLLSRFDKLRLLLVDQYVITPGKPFKLTRNQEQINAAFLEARINVLPYVDRCIFLIGNSHTVAPILSDGILDLVFHDADHTYKAVRRDLKALYPKVRSGGLYSGHDYGGKSDKRGSYGVKRAVDEFAKKHGYTVNVEGLVWWFKKR